MPPPVTFEDITVIPYVNTVTVAEFNVANEFWYRYITAVDIVLGLQTQTTDSIRVRVFESDGTTGHGSLYTGTPGWWNYLPAGTYYIKVSRFPVAPITVDLVNSFDTVPANPSFPAGTILIPDDTSPFIAILLSPTGTVLGYQTGIPAGEFGAKTSTGFVLIHDRFGLYTINNMILFSPTLAHVATINLPTPLSTHPLVCSNGTDFYVLGFGGAAYGILTKITTAGVATELCDMTPDLPDGPCAVAVSTDGLTVFIAEYTSAVIRKFNALTGALIGNFHTIAGFTDPVDTIALTPNSWNGEMLIMPDGSLVTWWYKNSNQSRFLIHVNSAGVLLNQYTFAFPTDQIDHIDRVDSTSSTTIELWQFNNIGNDTGKIGVFDLTTGLFTSSFTTPLFIQGQNDAGTATMFGPSNSCPMMVLGTAVPTVPGLFTVITNRRFDTTGQTDGTGGTVDVAIPTPFFKTALLGD